MNTGKSLLYIVGVFVHFSKCQMFSQMFENNPDIKLQRKQCPPAFPAVSPFSIEYENTFEQCIVQAAQVRKQRHPDEGKRTNQVILSYGYDLITYNNVTTDDGYILTVFRVTGGAKSPTARGKPVVLLHHGLITASDNWLLQHGDRNIGYEVWLANARGTDYSQRHVIYNSAKDIQYWDFSFHEVGIYDVPAIIQLMLLKTGNKDIFYIGHSMGATVYSIALSEKPDLNDKIRAAFLMAPAIYIGHSNNPLRTLISIVGTPIQDMIYYALKGRFQWNRRILDLLGIPPAGLCAPTALRCGLCDNWIFFLYGYDAPQANYTNLPNMLSKILNTASVKEVVHFAQNLISCEFRKYDYGIVGNLARYGTWQPPAYNLKKITAPTYIFYADSDNLVPPVDAHKTKNAMLPETIKGMYRIEWPLFNHVDFVAANDADRLLYNRILELLNTYKNSNSV